MQRPAGESRLSNTSSSSEFLSRPWVHIALLIGAGALIGLLHETFRWPLKMPGHHGLELMAIMMFARCASGAHYAATTTSLGNVFVSAFFTHELMIQQVIYLLQGLLIDSCYPKLSQAKPRLNLYLWVLIAGFLAGMAHAIKPVFKWLMKFGIDFHAGSLVNGLSYPLMSHILFGAIGGIVGAYAWRAYQDNRQARQ
jgi:hypothetical protein